MRETRKPSRMVAAQSAKTSVDTSPRQRNSPLKKEEGEDRRIRKRSRASAAIDIESDSDSKMQKREKLVTSRWREPKVHYPLQTYFCQTKKDFKNHYGLDIEGKDPRLLKDSNVLEGD